MQRVFENLPKEFVSAVATYDYKTPIVEVLSKINSAGSVVVLKNKEYYGMVDAKTIASMGTMKMDDKFPLGKFAKRVPLVDNATSIEKSILYIFHSATKALPYSDGGKVKGIVKRETLLKAILSLHLLSNYVVGDAMSSPVIAIDSASSVAQAKASMENYKVSKIVVLDKGRIFGILAYNDVINYFAKTSGRLDAKKTDNISKAKNSMGNTLVEDICNRQVYSIDQNKPIEVGIRSLIEQNISSLLVTKAGKPVGIITIRDVFERVAARTEEVTENILISGLDENSKEYEEDIRAELQKLAGRIDKFGKFKVDYISLHIKRANEKNYEVYARIIMTKSGAIAASAFGYTIESAIKRLSENLYKSIRVKKELILTNRREEGKETREEYEQ